MWKNAEVKVLIRKNGKTRLNALIISFLLVMLASVPACSKTAKDEKASAPASKVDAAKKKEILEGLKTSFICPDENASIKDALAEGANCYVGMQLLEVTETLLDAGWSEDKVKAIIPNFRQGRDTTFFVVDRPSLGKSDAPVTMVEFTDMQCPYCSRYFKTSFSPIKTEYVDTGKVRYYQLNLPLPFHNNAQKSAEALYCANESGKMWELRDKEFSNQQALAVTDIKRYAKELGLDEKKFGECLDSGRYAQKVNEDMQTANKAGVNGTPGFVIAVTRSDGKIRGALISGAQPTEAFKAAIENALNKAKAN